ncbi:cation transporter [Ectothiorhodospira haloalkaliphila]|uniref:Cation transporter n=1 Tax=Ectothiorhodospira haloalkaliphila TaxID=421628 RepID=W8L5T1_9GAMM|nr:cation diffusion facilitator family transporter [Ectothiorhodospira haloalkaliphila]AHK79235.1 cation transporter [Ectothiorhodospira haloalkaliphila]
MKYFFSRENTSLVVSAVAAGLFALAGVAWGLWMGSLMILFDGAYSLISLLLSLLALHVARLIRQPGNRRFPFGYAALQPLVIAIKGMTITLLCAISLAAAVNSILAGGDSLQFGLAVVFTLISVIGCGLCMLYLRWSMGVNGSGLVAAEYQQWRMDTALSAAVLAGFIGAWGLVQAGQGHWAVYADPVMVLLVSAYFLWVPVRMTLNAVRELVLAAPPAHMERRVTAAASAMGLIPEQVRMTKVGPYLVLEVSLPAEERRSPELIRFGLYRALTGVAVRPVVLVHAGSDHDPMWPSLDVPGRR